MIPYETCPNCGGPLDIPNYPEPGTTVTATCLVCNAQWTFYSEEPVAPVVDVDPLEP